ncbi:hypothetical protein [Agarivorans sp.]|uniref:hypothetical protein n=1 Tax=Agarivorans sp. TaxID=1872412 RepID=UPI003D08A12A
MKDKHLRAIVIVLCLLPLISSIMKSAGIFNVELQNIEHIAGGDGVIHWSSAFVVATLLQWAYWPSFRIKRWLGLPKLYCLLYLIFTLDELAQIALPTRDFDLTDLLLNYFGLSCSFIIASLWAHYQQRHRYLR